MKQIYPKYLALFFLLYTGFSVAQVKVLRASLSSSVRDAHNIQVGNFKVQQSIGQMGITGPINQQNHAVLRGFLLPQNALTNEANVTDFDLLVYPNPFVDYLELSFSANVSGDLEFNLHDVSGRLIVQQIYDAKQKQRIELRTLAQGEYILSVEVMGKRFTRNLLNYKFLDKE
ncbi:MAG: T9SS type A sorting domain-containing protein [Bacteroidetes bacterium]|nr:T9SS type A sorting domain-containing protein [Bacteroidota bacterium]MDA0888302.1 T9SS type A sorting domain-containing protein [Bacteroidota bacterium]MDA1084619.1 T9SS type A sorting domain-containing protein [Bacteroidota bacterium]